MITRPKPRSKLRITLGMDLQIYNPGAEPYQLQLALEKDMLVGRW
jgi:hypothetical protein